MVKQLNEDVRKVINALPYSLREEMRAHARWLEDRVEPWNEKLPKRLRNRVNSSEFVTMAVYRRIVEIPTAQLKTIRAVLGHMGTKDTTAIQLRGEVIEKGGPTIEGLETLRSALIRVLNQGGAGYVVTATSPRELLRLMAESQNAPR